MTPEEINREIAEFCGRKPGAYYCSTCRECVPIKEVTSGGYHDECSCRVHLDLPNYFEDLNAMHEAESIIYDAPETLKNDMLRKCYYHNLVAICKRAGWKFAYREFRAAAPQRSEALLRTIGRWKEKELEGV